MKTIIKESGVEKVLSYVTNGIDWAKDFIGNHGAFADGQFAYDSEKDVYLCEKETYDWWEKVFADHEQLESRIEELKEIHGCEAVDKVIQLAGQVDLEGSASAINKELDEAFNQ